MGERTALALVLLVELLLFALFAERFASFDNAMELARASAELGLLALATTLVIGTGGIDLSIGSVMGLAAVSMGAARAAGAPMHLAAALALVVGILCGLVNGIAVTRGRIPPLVATLATMALIRGLAEGLTGGYTVYSGFPAGFLELGQGYAFGWIPPQLPLLVVAVAGTWLLLRRTSFGRRLEAIGHAPEAARHAGVRVERHLLIVYVASGCVAALAGLLYVAHLGQAKADAGTGYELAAITIVVLGGTPIAGGRATVGGTVLALLAVAVLQNGLLLAGLPSELASILLGVLLVGAVLLQRFLPGVASSGGAPALPSADFDMKNSQVAAIVAAILVGCLIVAASNAWLVRGLLEQRDGPGGPRRITVAMMPKNKSDPYFVSCREGAEEAARELGVDLIWDGPNETDAARQNDVVEAWITRGVDVIAVSVENAASVSTVLRKARAKGIKVLTWDADAEADARDFLINQATPEGIGFALADEAARILGGQGQVAIVTASLTAANQNAWIEHIRARLASAHPGLEIAVIRPSDGLRDKALSETRALLRAHSEVDLIITLAAAAVPGSAEAVLQEGVDIPVIGLSVPSLCRDYVHQGVIESIVLWNTVDLGYLTVHAARALANGDLRQGSTELRAGRLGGVEIAGDEVLLGVPFLFDAGNIDDFDF